MVLAVFPNGISVPAEDVVGIDVDDVSFGFTTTYRVIVRVKNGPDYSYKEVFRGSKSEAEEFATEAGKAVQEAQIRQRG
jgi:hypothetical protein